MSSSTLVFHRGFIGQHAMLVQRVRQRMEITMRGEILNQMDMDALQLRTLKMLQQLSGVKVCVCLPMKNKKNLWRTVHLLG